MFCFYKDTKYFITHQIFYKKNNPRHLVTGERAAFACWLIDHQLISRGFCPYFSTGWLYASNRSWRGITVHVHPIKPSPVGSYSLALPLNRTECLYPHLFTLLSSRHRYTLSAQTSYPLTEAAIYFYSVGKAAFSSGIVLLFFDVRQWSSGWKYFQSFKERTANIQQIFDIYKKKINFFMFRP